VTNNSPIAPGNAGETSSIEIGRAPSNGKMDGTDPFYDPELMDLSTNTGVLSMASPAGWVGRTSGTSERPNHTLLWETMDSGQPTKAYNLLPGQTLTGLSATRAQAQAAYLDSHFHVITNGSMRVFGLIERADILPPALSVTLTPSTMRAGSKLLSVTTTITVTDNYDPAPEIRLESIVANQTLKSGDISGATFDTDDRSFKLKPVAGRVYTVTYSATDGSGNKATASATVTVKK
jgi:hypothetical protein